MTKWSVVNAVKGSNLPPPARLIMMMLLDAADADTCRIPGEYTPSLTQLSGWTGLGRSTVARVLNGLESAGWVRRHRPTVEAARSQGARTQYRLCVGSDPESGAEKRPRKSDLVPQRDQGTSPTAGPEYWSHSGTSPTAGPEVVPQRDQRWSHSGTELVPERDTIPPTPPTPHTPHTRPAAPIGENDGENDDGSTAAPTPETAQTILAELVDHCAAGGVTLTSRIRGQYASAIKSALADGIAADTIRQALAGMIRDHVIDRPSWLDSRIVQAQTGPEIRRRPTTVTDQRHAQADAALAEVLAEMHT